MEVIDIVALAVSVSAIVVAAMGTLYTVYSSAFHKREIERQQRAVVNYVREHVERRIYKLNEKLVDSEKKWLDVNHLIASSQSGKYALDFTNTNNPIKFENHRYFENFGISKDDLSVDKGLVFVLMPFHPDFEGAFTAIRDACAPFGLLCLRGDEHIISGDILSHILKSIVKANLIICVVDGRNPNVFYELGIAHGLDKNVIIVTREHFEAITDIKSNKLVVYKNYNELTVKLEREIGRSFMSR